MRRTSSELEKARSAVRDSLVKYVANPGAREELSHQIAKFTASAIRDDRVNRWPTSSFVKLVDVFFNGRPA